MFIIEFIILYFPLCVANKKNPSYERIIRIAKFNLDFFEDEKSRFHLFLSLYEFIFDRVNILILVIPFNVEFNTSEEDVPRASNICTISVL